MPPVTRHLPVPRLYSACICHTIYTIFYVDPLLSGLLQVASHVKVNEKLQDVWFSVLS
jgi:hypothetical protein